MHWISADFGEVIAFLRAGEKAAGKIDANMLRVAEFGAERLRRNDPYQNRTGELRANTRAVGTDGLTIMEMGMFYASYVNNLGYSHWDDVEQFVIQQIDTGIDKMLEDL